MWMSAVEPSLQRVQQLHITNFVRSDLEHHSVAIHFQRVDRLSAEIALPRRDWRPEAMQFHLFAKPFRFQQPHHETLPTMGGIMLERFQGKDPCQLNIPGRDLKQPAPNCS